MQNYKLFTEKEISFANGLSVFDGPNGYGKTSTFDAIEFLITGKIKRVEDNEVISGNKGFSSNFLAKDSKRDVIIKGEFVKSEQESLIIVLCIPAIKATSKKKYNPKNICDLAQTYILSKFDLPQSEWDSPLDQTTIKSLRDEYFGVQNLEYYSKYHYVQQEDRLAYFKKSEKDRIVEIHKLFGIEKEKNNLDKAESLSRQLSAKINKIKAEIPLLQKEVELARKSELKEIEYVELLGGKQPWDKRDLAFNGAKSKELYEKYLSELNALRAFAENKEVFLKDRELKLYEQIPEKQKKIAIKASILDSYNAEKLDYFHFLNANIRFLNEQLNLAEQSKYSALNFDKICDILDIKSEKEIFKNILTNLNTACKNQTGLQKSISNIIDLRNKIQRQCCEVEGRKDGQCPYCGQIWTSEDELNKQFSETERLISETVGRENAAVKKFKDDLMEAFNQICYERIKEYIDAGSKIKYLDIFNEISDLKELRALILKCKPIFARLNSKDEIQKLRLTDDDLLEKYSNKILLEIEEIEKSKPAEYINICKQYNLENLYSNYYEGNDYFSLLSIEKVELKKQYIQYQYNTSFDGTVKKLNELCEQWKKLDELKANLNDYKTALKEALNSYRDKVVKHIEIPFFLYSSRLLQSYQSGQGVMIQSDGESIRFTVPGGEHDVLYTMSSGQLSAVLLSFSLALNKIYAGDNFNTLLIDDPIQCMDDINMVSFVELLRQEFADTQIIMSTHEETFSNFIQYKFNKFRQDSKAISLHD
jgi:exonuclease SbcC